MSDTPTISSTSVPSSSAPGASAPPLPPPRVPDHELIRPIGRGAYGEVWLARSVTGAFRAVKIVHRRSFDHARPFEREFEGILKFEPVSRTHDSQVDILHVGRGDDYFYYVMELADDQVTGGQINPDNYTARTLKSDVLGRGRIEFEECVRIGLALATALEHLHANGLVHRDVKPSNIVFVNGVPKLADIGLVTGVDATHTYVGTEGFAAPEGSGTAQADLYSLGKVLYEAATGKDRQEFPDLSTQLREWPDRDGLMELNAVIARACRHDPKDRYPSASAMRADLELLQSGKSLARLRRTEKQLRFVQRAGAVVTAIAALIAAGWLWQARQTRLVRELAAEKTKLVEESHGRLIRLNIANGVRLLDDGDPAGALLWFADSLSLMTNNPTEESIQRLRIQQTMDHAPHLRSVFAHPANVQCAVFSPDEKQIATACEDGLVRIWDSARNDKPVAEYRQPQPPRLLHYTRDGRRLLVVTAPTSLWYATSLCLIVLDAATGHAALPAFTDVTAWAASADDHWLAVAKTNHVIELYELTSGQLAAAMPGHQDFVNDINFSPDDRQIVTASFDRTARRWEIPSGTPLGQPLLLNVPVFRTVFSPDGKRLATATLGDRPAERGEFQIWDAATGVAVGQPREAKDGIFVLNFDRIGRHLFAGDRQYLLSVRDTRTGDALPSVKLASYACSFDCSPVEDLIAVGSDNGNVGIWNIESAHAMRHSLFHAARVESVRFDSTGQRLLTASGDGTAKLWDFTSPKPSHTLRLEGEWPKIDPGGIRPSFVREPGPMQIPLMGGTVRLIDPENLREVYCLVPSQTNASFFNVEAAPNGRHWQLSGNDIMELVSQNADGTIRRVALQPAGRAYGGFFSLDSSRLFTVGRDRTIRVWSTADGHLELSVRIPEPFTNAVYPSLDTQSALLVQENGMHQWFDLASQRLLGSPFPMPGVWAMRLDPTGQRIAIVGQDQTLRVWNTLTGEPASPVFIHAGTEICLDWSPDGRRLLTAGLSADARIWDAPTGEQVLSPFTLGNEPLRAARWSPDGRFIVARSDEQLVRVWDAATGEPVTPKLRQANYVRLAAFRSNRRLILAIDPNLLLAWDLTEIRLPAEVVADYAKLLSGRRLSAGGVMVPLKPTELADLCRSLRARAPQLFE